MGTEEVVVQARKTETRVRECLPFKYREGFLRDKLSERDEIWHKTNLVYSEFLSLEFFWYFWKQKYEARNSGNIEYKEIEIEYNALMFTLDQIHEAHAKVKSGADFPHYIQDLIVLGVQKYDIFVHDGHGEYASAYGDTLVSPPKYDTITVADTNDAEGFTERLRAHQQDQTDYMTFCQESANAGVEKWTVDTTAMTCTYYDKAGQMMLEEKIPKPK